MEPKWNVKGRSNAVSSSAERRINGTKVECKAERAVNKTFQEERY